LSAQGLADHFGNILTKTISAKPIKLEVQKISDGQDSDWTISNFAEDMDRLPMIEPVALKNKGFLKFEHVVRVLDATRPERNLNKMATISYSYQYSTTSPEDSDWVFRYEYEVEAVDPHSRYPAGHLHVNSEPKNYAQIETVKGFPSLHLPTRRLSLEEIIWHLINEHTPGISSADKDEWFVLLDASKAGYETRILDEQTPPRPPLLEG
jgi:hypothetical protein